MFYIFCFGRDLMISPINLNLPHLSLGLLLLMFHFFLSGFYWRFTPNAAIFWNVSDSFLDAFHRSAFRGLGPTTLWQSAFQWWDCRRQGCQIFVNELYQNGGKYTKLPLNDPMAKIYPMAEIYSKWTQNTPTSFNARHSKIYPNSDFRFENISSGNPGRRGDHAEDRLRSNAIQKPEPWVWPGRQGDRMRLWKSLPKCSPIQIMLKLTFTVGKK
jgi:hypothetical protein